MNSGVDGTWSCSIIDGGIVSNIFFDVGGNGRGISSGGIEIGGSRWEDRLLEGDSVVGCVEWYLRHCKFK